MTPRRRGPETRRRGGADDDHAASGVGAASVRRRTDDGFEWDSGAAIGCDEEDRVPAQDGDVGGNPEDAGAGGAPLPGRRGFAAALVVLGSLLVVPSLVLPATSVGWGSPNSPTQLLFEQWVAGRVRWATPPTWAGSLPPHGDDAPDVPVALVLLVAAVVAGVVAGVLWWSARSRGRLAAAAAVTVLAMSLYLGGVSAGAREVAFGALATPAGAQPVASVTPAGGLGIVALAAWSAALTLMLWQLRRRPARATTVGRRGHGASGGPRG